VLLTKAWAWLKKSWYWVAFPVGLLLLFFRKRRNFNVVPSELQGAADKQKQIDQEYAADVEKAEQKRELAKKQVEELYQKDLDEIKQRQEELASTYKDKPEALNRFLLDVSKKMRE